MIDPIAASLFACLALSPYASCEIAAHAGQLVGEEDRLCQEEFPAQFRMRELPDSGSALDCGSAIAFPSRHFVIFTKGFRELDEPTRRYILLHECGHLHHQDVPMRVVANIIGLIASALFFPSYFALSELSIFLITQCAHGAIIERRADAFAISHATRAELQAAIAFLETRQTDRWQQWCAATSLTSLFKSVVKAFTYYIFEGHPLESSRIALVQKKLQSLPP